MIFSHDLSKFSPSICDRTPDHYDKRSFTLLNAGCFHRECDTLHGKAFLTFLYCVIGLMFRRQVDCAKIKAIQLSYDSDTKLIATLNSAQQTVYKDGAYYRRSER